MRMNGFYNTKLDALLRGFGVENVVVTGAWTNFSVEHTARHGADAGYNMIVATDGTSTIDDAWQNAGINFALENIAERVTCADIAAALK